MPLFEVETEGHIIITWAADEEMEKEQERNSYPNEGVIRLTKRPRDTWVISKSALGIQGTTDPCSVARDCLAKAEGDKAAERTFTFANEVEKIHAALYQKLKDSLSKDMEEYPYWVCPVCGYTAEQEAPERCPVCNAKGSRFKKVD